MLKSKFFLAILGLVCIYITIGYVYPGLLRAFTVKDGARLFAAGKYEKAVRVFETLRDSDGHALLYLSVMSHYGLFLPKDETKAKEYLDKTGLKTIGEAWFYLSEFDRSIGEYPQWIKKLERSGEENYPPAQYELGKVYREGLLHRKKDSVKAEYWRLQAAENDFAPAWNELGMLQVLNRNFSGAETSFRKAAELGHAGAAALAYDMEKQKMNPNPYVLFRLQEVFNRNYGVFRILIPQNIMRDYHVYRSMKRNDPVYRQL